MTDAEVAGTPEGVQFPAVNQFELLLPFQVCATLVMPMRRVIAVESIFVFMTDEFKTG